MAWANSNVFEYRHYTGMDVGKPCEPEQPKVVRECYTLRRRVLDNMGLGVAV